MARQVLLEPEVALTELPFCCDWGVKQDTDGNFYRWRGYKAHLSWADGMVPLLCVTTSASVHDSQVVIPMLKRVARSVTCLYDLMDSAYDAPAIREVSTSLGHVALIDRNPRRGEKVPFAPCEAIRFRERSNAERGNSRLKDSFGLRFVRVRGSVNSSFRREKRRCICTLCWVCWLSLLTKYESRPPQN